MNYRQVSCESSGQFDSEAYRIFFFKDTQRISPWHDIPYKSVGSHTKRGEYTCVIEIPKETEHKLEMCKKDPLNPIRHDLTRDGDLRKYPYPIRWNYGFIPQTWEDPSFMEKDVENLYGDDDPIDVVEIGSVIHNSGDIVRVKVLGAFSMIDDGELDWKIVVVDSSDPIASLIDSDEDVETYIDASTLHDIKEWFRNYKKTTARIPTRFGHQEMFVNIQTAIDAIETTHIHWKQKYEIVKD